MNLLNLILVWSWLLGVSFVIPVALPAGGFKKSIIEHRENNSKSPLIAIRDFNLLSTVDEDSSILTSVKSGTPVEVLQVWDSPENGKWLLVNVLSRNYHQFFDKRGWVNLGT